MKNNIILNLFLLLFLSFKANADIILDFKAFEGLSKTYNYYLIQKKQINYIKKEYPSLSMEAQLALTNLNNNFSGAIGEINRKMNEVHPSLWKKEKTKILNGIDLYDFNFLTKESAKIILEEVNTNKTESLPEDILKVLLSFNPNYMKEPFLELSDNKTYVYDSKSSSKNNNIRFTIVLPKSWKEVDSSNINIVTKFKSFAGYGSEQIRFITEKIDVETANYIKNNGIKDFISEEGALNYLSGNANLLGKGAFKGVNHNGFWIHYGSEDSLNGMKTTSETIDYILIHDEKIITISVYLTKDFNGIVINKEPLSNYKMLLDLIAASLIIY